MGARRSRREPLLSVKIYVEGGGLGHHSSLSKCRIAFGRFFERLLRGKGKVSVIPCGGRAEAWRDFTIAHEKAEPRVHIILLVDSEGPVGTHVSPWDFLRDNERDKWQKPPDAEDDQAHLMVQCMEAWFMADLETVVKYFSEHAKTTKQPKVSRDIEQIPKATIMDVLRKAARRFHKGKDTKMQGYEKVQDGFALLELIDPEKVCKASRHTRRLRDTLEKRLPDRP